MALYVNGKQVSGGGGGNTNSVELTYAEYQALTPEQQLDGTEYFITDINGDGQDFQPIIYSEEEREIGVWTDGKPLYQLTCVGNAVTAGQSGAVDLTDYSIDTFVGVDSGASMFIRSDGGQGYTLNGNELQDSQWGITVYGSPSAVVVNTRRFGLTSWYVTIHYTKTTDQAGSGTWTPQGVPAHHYSTDEQVVGTWVDGSTLYEKTIDYTVNKSASHTFDFTDGNVKRVVGGFIINSLNSICFPVNCSWEGKTEEFLYDETHFYIKTSANLGDSNTLRIIVQYTKSST